MTRRLVAGVLAGAVGTLSMDLVWYRRYKAGGGESSFLDWDDASDIDSFEDAGPPAQIGEMAAHAVGAHPPARLGGVATNVVHWLTGTGYGIVHVLGPGVRNPVVDGAMTGTGAFAASYAVLGALGLYEPIWTYDRDTLVQDWTAHLAYGLGTSLAYRLLTAVTSRS
jgi:hypothetical protein